MLQAENDDQKIPPAKIRESLCYSSLILVTFQVLNRCPIRDFDVYHSLAVSISLDVLMQNKTVMECVIL